MNHDLLVIGGGAAGMAAARAARHLGRSVALVQDGPVGGDCTFTGCIPSKTLLAAAERGLSFPAAMARVRDTVAAVAAPRPPTCCGRRASTSSRAGPG
ncbi:MAG: FAD-dependent oxidoreductase [Mycobacteriales bacterium]